MQRLQQAARTGDVFVSMGFSERNPASVGGMWNSNVLISDEGVLLNHHRKIVPTFYEKLIWSNGDGHGLKVIETRLGKIGALICGENTNPLATVQASCAKRRNPRLQLAAGLAKRETGWCKEELRSGCGCTNPGECPRI